MFTRVHLFRFFALLGTVAATIQVEADVNPLFSIVPSAVVRRRSARPPQSEPCLCDTTATRAALLSLYASAMGRGWFNNTGWADAAAGRSDGLPVCDWFGVVCNGAGLQYLLLSQNNLTGTLAPDLGPALATAAAVHMHFNTLSGQLPSQWAAHGGMPNLEEVTLYFNHLSGPLPDSWGSTRNVRNLRLFYVEDNTFAGGVPPSWVSGMPRMEVLFAYDNAMGGFIPPFEAWGATLRRLVLEGNQLQGLLPAAVGRWNGTAEFPRMVSFLVPNNQLSGPVRFNFCPDSPWRALLVADQFQVQANALTGRVDFCEAAQGSEVCQKFSMWVQPQQATAFCGDGCGLAPCP